MDPVTGIIYLLGEVLEGSVRTLFLGSVVAVIILWMFYHSLDEFGWNNGSKPSVHAKIKDVDVRRLGEFKSKYGDKYRWGLTFNFLDGFYYSSEILLPLEQQDIPIIELAFSQEWQYARKRAIKAHLKAAHSKTGEKYEEPDEVSDIKAAKFSRGGARKTFGLIIFLVVVFGIWSAMVQPVMHIREGDKLMEAGDYDGAISEYSSAGGNASEKLKEAKQKRHEVMMRDALNEFVSGDYHIAISILKKIKYDLNNVDKNKLENTIMNFIEREVSYGKFEDAINILMSSDISSYVKPGNASYSWEWEDGKKKLRDVINLYITHEIEAENYDNALKLIDDYHEHLNNKVRGAFHDIQIKSAEKEAKSGRYREALKYLLTNNLIDYLRMNDAIYMGLYREFLKDNASDLIKAYEGQVWEEGKEKLKEIFAEYTDKIIEELSHLESKDYEIARERGETIRNVDAQLKYCHALYNLGYDLKSVYPNGVEVTDIDLKEYQVTNIIENNSSGGNMNFFPIIIFWREELSYPMKVKSPVYLVRLLPGEMFAYGSGLAAKTFDDAACLLLADGIYVKTGSVEQTIRRPSIGFSNTQELPIYSAVNNLSMYSTKNPSNGIIMTANVHEPNCANEEWLKDHQYIIDSDRLGDFDYTSVMENLPKAMMYAYIYGEGSVEENNTSDDKSER